MNSRLWLGSSAQADLRGATQWYEVQKAGLGGEFLDEVDQIFHRVRQAPHHFPEVESGVRRALLRRFPYAVYFVADSDGIEILAVLHLRRHHESGRKG